MESIEKVLGETDGVIVEDGVVTAVIMDAELDRLDLSFVYDGCVDIDTRELNHIKLSKNNLYKLIELIDYADEQHELMED